MRLIDTTKVVNRLPLPAHSTPPNTPPISAGLRRTRVFGTNMYRNVKPAITMTYGASELRFAIHVPIGSIDRIQLVAVALASVAKRPIATLMSSGPTKMHAQILAEAAHEAAWPIHAPYEVEAALDLLRERERATRSSTMMLTLASVGAADVVDEFDDPHRDLRAARSDRRQEVLEQRLEVPVETRGP